MFLAEAYFHTLDPFAVEFPASWPIAGIRWYGLSYAAGFIIAWIMFRWFARTRRSPLTVQQVGDLMFAIIIGVLVGGRVGYALFYDRHLFIGFTRGFPFWDLLAINKGGMASHGGIIGVILACWWFARRHNVPFMHLFDMAALGSTPGLFLGRLANFVNGELHGRALPNQANPPWWSMKFPQELHEWSADRLAALNDLVTKIKLPTYEFPGAPARLAPVSPEQWSEALHAIAANPNDPPEDAVNFVGRIIDQIILATQNHEHAVIEALRPLLTAFYPSQFIQALTDGPILAAFLCLLWLRPRRPGVIAMCWLIGYGVLRIITELWREPDQGVALTFGILSRGQTLSILMILGGAAGLVITMRTKAAKMGGLMGKRE
jgi:phosphatidylglycerol:prolipoprotein diacylglycerol transferase